MSLKITSRKAKIVELIFLGFLIISILFSIFKPIQAGTGKIGIKAIPLGIGDRNFYIYDKDPLAIYGKNCIDSTFNICSRGSPLYPNVLRGISFITIKLFNQSSTSYLWNTITIIFSSFLTFSTLRLTYASGKLLCDESTGTIAMTFLAICPYTYFYALSGGITIYTLFGTSLSTYLILKINKFNSKIKKQNKSFLAKIFLSLILIYMALLRPSSIIFCLLISLIVITKEIISLIKSTFNKRMSTTIIILFVISTLIAIDQLLETKTYTSSALYAFTIEKGTFMGVERELMRDKIEILLNSQNTIKTIEGFLYNSLWKINDFLTGIIDIRDTHSPQTVPLLSFILRVSVGTFLIAPITYISLLGTYIYREHILKSGLWIILLSSTISLSPSLMGVAMSRYYYMFITPFILIAAMAISRISKYKFLEEIK